MYFLLLLCRKYLANGQFSRLCGGDWIADDRRAIETESLAPFWVIVSVLFVHCMVLFVFLFLLLALLFCCCVYAVLYWFYSNRNIIFGWLRRGAQNMNKLKLNSTEFLELL